MFNISLDQMFPRILIDDRSTEIAKNYGGGVGSEAVRVHLHRDVRPIVKAMGVALENGEDPHMVVHISEPKNKGQKVFERCLHSIMFFTRASLLTSLTEIAKHYGGGLKGHALRERFRRDINPFAQPMVDAVKNGEDPLQVVLISESGKGQIWISDITQHVFLLSTCYPGA